MKINSVIVHILFSSVQSRTFSFSLSLASHFKSVVFSGLSSNHFISSGWSFELEMGVVGYYSPSMIKFSRAADVFGRTKLHSRCASTVSLQRSQLCFHEELPVYLMRSARRWLVLSKFPRFCPQTMGMLGDIKFYTARENNHGVGEVCGTCVQFGGLSSSFIVWV